MAQRFDRQTFERVFSDAHVIDVDFSEWDKHITLWTLADHYENWATRCPVVVVQFEAVRQFECHMPVPDFGLDSPHQHLQWNIDDFEIKETGSTICIRLFGPTSAPTLIIECAAILFRAANADVLDQTFPGWNRPYSGLARPSIDKMIKVR